MADEPEVRTIPDPSTLTTEQLERAIENLKELLQTEVAGLESVIEERFDSVKTQFSLIERQRVEQKTDTGTAVDAALAAAKEAVGKSEVSTKEQLGAMRAETTAGIKVVTEAVADLKERLVAMESQKRGHQEGVGISANVAAWLVGTGLVVVGFVLTVYLATRGGS